MSFTFSIAWVLFAVFMITGTVGALAALTIPEFGRRFNEAVTTTAIVSLAVIALVAAIEALS
jgi:anti-sigma factor RsiW